MTRYERWLEHLRADPPARAELAQASLARIMTTLDQRAHLRVRARRLASGLFGIAACAIVAQQLGLLSQHASQPTHDRRDPQVQADTRTTPAAERASVPEAVEAAPALDPTLPPASAQSTPAPSRGTRELRRSRGRSSTGVAPAAPLQLVAPAQHGAPSSSDTRATSTPPVSEASLRGLFEVAHRLQFRGTPSAALSAWDQYLATDSSGPLSIEARYYRALTLLRLGQTSAARTALLPFVRGEFGEFRQRDAARWLEQLDAAPTPR
jgi:hypothetical protein